MFNIGPLELVVLAIVALVVLGPDKLPGFVRDATRMLRTLRELATGARQQLREELGPEFADVDFRNLNPRTAITKAVFGDDAPDLRKFDPRGYDAKSSAKNLLFGDDTPAAGSAGESPISMTKGGEGSVNGASVNGASVNGASANGSRPRPRPRPQSGFDDVT